MVELSLPRGDMISQCGEQLRQGLCVFQAVAVSAAASRRSSTYWSRVQSGCDILNPVKYLCNAFPKSVGEVLNSWGSLVQVSCLVSLDIGSVYLKANTS